MEKFFKNTVKLTPYKKYNK